MIGNAINLSTAEVNRALNAVERRTAEIVILGAGPAGLSAAYSLAQAGRSVVLIEREATPGGLCRTFDFHGNFFDLGPHVFIHRNEEIGALLHELGDKQLREITHIEGIYFEGKFYDSWFDAVVGLNMLGKMRAMFGLLMRRARPIRRVISCEDGLINSYGSTIYSRLVKVHQCKFWGVDPAEIDVSWARVYEKPTSITSYLKRQLVRSHNKSVSYEPAKTYYPTLGSQVIYRAMEQRIQRSSHAAIVVDADVVALHREGATVKSVEVRKRGLPDIEIITGEKFISTIPVTELVCKFVPAPPPEIADIAATLRYRSLVVVNLLVPLIREFPYGWVEVHSAGIKAGRVTNFARLSPEMARGGGLVPICLEYYCFEGDEVWLRNDDELMRLACDELVAMGLSEPGQQYNGFVHRERCAYPMYLLGYVELRAQLKAYLDQLENLQSIGRGGIYRYNNMGHSIESGLRAAENVLLGQRHDLWDRKVVDGKI